MLKSIILSVVLSVAVAKPTAVLTPVVASVSSQYHAQDALGQYSYGYTNSHSAKSEYRLADGVTRGGYSYIDAEGKLQSIEYIADPVNGFRASGSNIPSQPNPAALLLPVQVTDTPEVAEARKRHLAAVEEAKLRTTQPFIVAPPTSFVPATFTVRNDANLIAANNFLPSFYYSYDIQNGIINQPVLTAYSSQFLVPKLNVESPAAREILEVAKARAEHLAAVENEKNNKSQS